MKKYKPKKMCKSSFNPYPKFIENVIKTTWSNGKVTYGDVLKNDVGLRKVYSKHKPADMVFMANTQIIRELAVANPTAVAESLYELWTAVKEYCEQEQILE